MQWPQLWRRVRRLWPALVFGLFSACSPAAVPTLVPTQTLIPPTETHTPTPITPTLTPPSLPGPADVLATATAAAQALSPENATGELTQQIQTDLARHLNLPEERIRLVLVESVFWPNADLSCADDPRPSLQEAVAGYRALLVVGAVVYEYHATAEGLFSRCEAASPLEGALLVEIDPVAADLVALAQARVAQQTDLPTRRIQLVDARPILWSDSSLGCPAAGQTYTAADIQGYRIMLRAGETEFIFHTDSVQIVLCPAEREQLPSE